MMSNSVSICCVLSTRALLLSVLVSQLPMTLSNPPVKMQSGDLLLNLCDRLKCQTDYSWK